MNTSTALRALNKAAPFALLLGALGTTAWAHADDPPEAAGSDLAHLSGSWFCTVEVINGNDTVATTGTMHFSPWDAWVVGSFTPTIDANVVTDGNTLGGGIGAPPAHWPPYGGHGPVVHPPQGDGSPNNLTFFAYDPIAKAYVSFKFLGSGTYAMASSAGPDADGTWDWEGALSDNGAGIGSLVRATTSTSDPNTFNAVGSISTDVGQTWITTEQVRCVKQAQD